MVNIGHDPMLILPFANRERVLEQVVIPFVLDLYCWWWLSIPVKRHYTNLFAVIIIESTSSTEVFRDKHRALK